MGPPLLKNACFRSETVEKRLDLTSYMRYTDVEGRGPPPNSEMLRMLRTYGGTCGSTADYGQKALFCVFVINMVFWPETVEKRLDLTSHMSYTDAEGRGSQSPTALSIHIAHIAR